MRGACIKANQQGSALMMSLAILLMISMIAILTAQVGAIEHRVTGNHFRAKQAAEAGQAGISDAMRNLNRQTIQAIGGVFNNQTLTLQDVAGNAVVNQALNSGGNNIANYSVNYSTLPAPAPQAVPAVHDQILVNINAQSADTGAVSGVNQVMTFRSTLFNQPEAPVIAGNTINLNGSTVANQGAVGGGIANAALWTGGNIPGPSEPTIDLGAGSGTGIMQNDANLAGLAIAPADGFFNNFFRFSRAATQASATPLNCAPTCIETDPVVQAFAGTGGILWVTGNLTLGNGAAITVGSNANPAIIIMDGGTLRLESGSIINGLVYIAGSWNNANRIGAVNGAVLAEGSVQGSNLTITYSAAIANAMLLGSYTPIAGTWRDW